ncbi:MAG: hypothetical protein V1737_00125 [Chloroflexota bacterium]
MSFQQYVRDSEHFYDQSCLAFGEGNDANGRRCAVASILFSFMAVESFINNMMKDFASLPEALFTVHERGFLEERLVQFEPSGRKAGEFALTNRRDYRSLEDKIMFLIAKSGGGAKIDKGAGLWQDFEKSKELRDRLTHPRRGAVPSVTSEDAKDTLDAARQVIQLISAKVWKRRVQL